MVGKDAEAFQNELLDDPHRNQQDNQQHTGEQLMSTIDQLARRLKKALTLHRKWANETRRVKQELDVWEQENGKGDAVWHLLLWELSLAVRQQVFCRDLSRHLHDQYRSERERVLASVFPPEDPDDF